MSDLPLRSYELSIAGMDMVRQFHLDAMVKFQSAATAETPTSHGYTFNDLVLEFYTRLRQTAGIKEIPNSTEQTYFVQRDLPQAGHDLIQKVILDAFKQLVDDARPVHGIKDESGFLMRQLCNLVRHTIQSKGLEMTLLSEKDLGTFTKKPGKTLSYRSKQLFQLSDIKGMKLFKYLTRAGVSDPSKLAQKLCDLTEEHENSAEWKETVLRLIDVLLLEKVELFLKGNEAEEDVYFKLQDPNDDFPKQKELKQILCMIYATPNPKDQPTMWRLEILRQAEEAGLPISEENVKEWSETISEELITPMARRAVRELVESLLERD